MGAHLKILRAVLSAYETEKASELHSRMLTSWLAGIQLNQWRDQRSLDPC
jgi:hypothetical protein